MRTSKQLPMFGRIRPGILTPEDDCWSEYYGVLGRVQLDLHLRFALQAERPAHLGRKSQTPRLTDGHRLHDASIPDWQSGRLPRQASGPTRPAPVGCRLHSSPDPGEHPEASRVDKGGSLSTWAVVYERTATGWSAYVPALPGVGVVGTTHEETERLVSGAIAMHLEGLVADGLPIPEPGGVDVGEVELPLPA